MHGLWWTVLPSDTMPTTPLPWWLPLARCTVVVKARRCIMSVVEIYGSKQGEMSLTLEDAIKVWTHSATCGSSTLMRKRRKYRLKSVASHQ